MQKSNPKYKVGDIVLYHTDYGTEPCTFTIKRVEMEDSEDDDPRYIYHDSEENESGGFLYEEDIDGLSTDSTPINERTLSQQEWILYSLFGGKFIRYEKSITCGDRSFLCDLQKESNTVGRDWCLHVDNEDAESIGSMDVATFGQIDRFLKLLSE